MKNFDNEISKIEQGDAWNDTDEVVELSVKKPLDKVIPVRLPAETWEKLRQEAKELGIGPTTLARMWIIERLRVQSLPYHDMLNMLEFMKQNYPEQKTAVSEQKSSYENK